ncbi:hypothetical protein ACFWYW_24240 [Nonomuraea sp. NPDC059023]|uniref:hypothetical protein n=1 Tax=unclassified Nonomuraea TaxID=2593643 RepID=UPI0036B68CA3
MPEIDPTTAAPATAAPTPASGDHFTAADIEKAREQEKAKLYGRISKQDEKLSTLQAQLEDVLAERKAAAEQATQLQAEREDAERKAREEEMSVRQLLQTKEQEWNDRFAQIERERETERAALEKDRQFAELQGFVQRRVREESEAGTIAPELVDLISGNTPDEVEASITLLRDKTNSIVANMQAATSAVAPPPAPRGVSPAGYAATGPLDMDSVTKTITPEELRAMPMSEYAKLRPALIGRAAAPNASHGLFG